MMSKEGKFRYEEANDFQAIALSYTDRRLQMVLFLPATNSNPKKLLAEFGSKSFDLTHLNIDTVREGTITFPKFKLDYNVMLNDALKSLGMRRAFTEGAADFSAIADQPLFVSEIMQKSFVSVDEKGTEASAITLESYSNAFELKPPPPFQMLINRPFLFVINDVTTGATLFIGIVNDPTL